MKEKVKSAIESKGIRWSEKIENLWNDWYDEYPNDTFVDVYNEFLVELKRLEK